MRVCLSFYWSVLAFPPVSESLEREPVKKHCEFPHFAQICSPLCPSTGSHYWPIISSVPSHILSLFIKCPIWWQHWSFSPTENRRRGSLLNICLVLQCFCIKHTMPTWSYGVSSGRPLNPMRICTCSVSQRMMQYTATIPHAASLSWPPMRMCMLCRTRDWVHRRSSLHIYYSIHWVLWILFLVISFFPSSYCSLWYHVTIIETDILLFFLKIVRHTWIQIWLTFLQPVSMYCAYA